MTPQTEILFYGHTSGEYRQFSNFFDSPIVIDEKFYPTVEHYYQAMKAETAKDAEKIRKAKTPHDAKKLGRKIKIRSNWDDKKFNIMLNGLYAKFTQNPELAVILLETGDVTIHEDCKDSWWGGGPNFPGGRDWLGKALMIIRKKLRENKIG